MPPAKSLGTENLGGLGKSHAQAWEWWSLQTWATSWGP